VDAPASPLRRRLVRGFGLFAFLPLSLALLGLASCQGRMIYPGQRYAPIMWERVPPNLVPLRYDTDQGKQVSFYQPPSGGGEAQRLWLVCNGNGGYALQWPGLIEAVGDPAAGFLFFEYPGYGFSQGSCTPGRILRASEAAVEALRVHLRLPEDRFASRLGVFGHSLGAATALQYAAKHPVRRIVLAAPFTSMVEMGHRMLFWPCGQLVWHRFDNTARLAEIAAQQPRPPVIIVHGGLDNLIPPEMSQRLAEPYAGWVTRRVVPGVDHDEIVLDALPLLREP